MKRTLILALALALSCVMAVTGTIAYLSDTDEDVNVMTLGNVDIEQLEFERVDTEVIPGELRAFTADKPLYPVYAGPATIAETAKQNWDEIGLDAESELLPLSIIGDVDKFVFVKNIGTSDAYVRTWFAFEQGEVSAATHSELIKTLTNSTDWTWSEAIPDMLIKRGETSTKYVVYSATYNKALPAGAMTEPSLLQLYLSSDAQSADCLALDGNGNGRYDVIVLSQAVQTTNFDDAEIALGAAFGEADGKYNPFVNTKAIITPDTWSEAADTSWYNENDTVFEIETADQLAGLAELVDDGVTFEGKTVRLVKDVDLYKLGADGEPVCFDPIGSYRHDLIFKGTFDGLGHTIRNMSQNTWALNNGYYYGDLGLGLFGYVEDATIKNLVMDNASISGENGLCGTVAAAAYGDCVFENITVTNTEVADYQYYAGGIVGWASGDHKYVNCDVAASTTIGGQWGDFGNANGGLIGGAGKSGTYYFENCDVACRIDAVNDVVSAYQWHSYRNSGMIIGTTGVPSISSGTATADASNVTAVNCTVTYGDWANYTYCEFAGTGYPYVRVQAGTSVDAYSNVRYGHPTDASGNTVVDDNHTHNDGEAHHKLIAFDQLFGGNAQARFCVYGLATHPGVEVIYNNK